MKMKIETDYGVCVLGCRDKFGENIWRVSISIWVGVLSVQLVLCCTLNGYSVIISLPINKFDDYFLVKVLLTPLDCLFMYLNNLHTTKLQ